MHDQIRYMELQRIQENGDHKIDAKGHNLSWKVLCYALKFSMPTIIKGMGFTSANAQLMTIGPYSIGAISSYIFGRFSDKVIWRMPLY
uniref:Uncharacterized protein n=1 Tax=Moniliophthora roreri TaxID=221103 RepID=A0A0W0G2A5_MONRR